MSWVYCNSLIANIGLLLHPYYHAEARKCFHCVCFGVCLHVSRAGIIAEGIASYILSIFIRVHLRSRFLVPTKSWLYTLYNNSLAGHLKSLFHPSPYLIPFPKNIFCERYFSLWPVYERSSIDRPVGASEVWPSSLFAEPQGRGVWDNRDTSLGAQAAQWAPKGSYHKE